ncbi:MAG TPA: RIO1 family regulatory kinase/ATPase [Micromonosporaceae bacterium]|nr:RIO1 family regulatory kinase/ATPase [Micromonosporaceae bacterium]
MREHEYDHDFSRPAGRRGRRRFDDDEPVHLIMRRPVAHAADLAVALDEDAGAGDPDAPPSGDRWSTWDTGLRGPEPYPDWVVTDLAAVDTDLGILKTGKEADVHLVRREVPGTDRSCLLASKRYRGSDHRLFHRDAGYLEGRRVRRSRETRAMGTRTGFGRQLIAGQWAAAEFDALARLWRIGREYGGVSVPYPVQLLGTEVLLEFVADPHAGPDAGQAAPRLAQLRPDARLLAELWRQAVEALTVLARAGLAHGDLSAYNMLVAGERLVLIDLPQVVDVVANPQGREFLARDVSVVARWFAARGLPDPDPRALTRTLLAEAGIR